MNTYPGSNLSRSNYNPFNTNMYQMPMIYGRMVNNENDIFPNQIPNDGSMAYFPTTDGNKIYARAWRPDGTIMSVTYTLDQPVMQQTNVVQPQAQQPQQPAQALQKQINEIEPEIAHLYKATLSIDGWVAGDTFAYIQTVPLLAIGTGPQVDSDSVFCSGAMCEQTASPETNQFLVEALGIINIGRVTLGSDTVTVEVSEKPEIEIEAIWQIKRG